MWIIKGLEDDVRVCGTTKYLRRAAWSDLSDWSPDKTCYEEADKQALVIPGGGRDDMGAMYRVAG